MRVVITGATGNVGTSLVEALASDHGVDSILGLARRPPATWRPRKVEWAAADVVTADLVSLFRGADAVVHLAWLIQPSHDLDVLRAVNVDGSHRVFRAVAEAGVPALVYASSVGAYSPGPKDRPVDETWPTAGIDSSFYARHKAEVERLLDSFEADYPGIRVVRMRPGLIFKREAASGIRRLFFGPLVPTRLLRPSWIPVVPRVDRLVFQCLHTSDVAEAYRLAVTGDVHGAFNVAADPVLDGNELARALGAKPLPVPGVALRVLADVTWRAHLQPTPSGWVDMALSVPILSTAKARQELGWAPRYSSHEALLDLLEGLADACEGPTPALARRFAQPELRELQRREAGAAFTS
ncbi:MAG: NAD-dependent epimerase/dehydratase family protein [Actinomycetota bacterium]|nr:NAD-dependent epimerase/dehydratase family protein [Actinomycetota bacterium]